jgi:hypothetical protein
MQSTKTKGKPASHKPHILAAVIAAVVLAIVAVHHTATSKSASATSGIAGGIRVAQYVIDECSSVADYCDALLC